LVCSFFYSNNISNELTFRVWHFIKHNRLLKTHKTSIDEVPVFRTIPKSLQEDLHVEAYSHTFLKHSFFQAYACLDRQAYRRLVCSSVHEISLMPQQELFCRGEKVDKMIFVIGGQLQYKHDDPYLEDVSLTLGEWACEEALWGAWPCLDVPMAAGMRGAQLVALRAKDFHENCKACPDTLQFVLLYAERWISEFNEASLDDHCGSENILFNDVRVLDHILHRAVAEYDVNIARAKSVFCPEWSTLPSYG